MSRASRPAGSCLADQRREIERMVGPTMRPRFNSGSERFLEALRVAATLHAGKARKKTDMPDVGHLLGTCSIAMEFGANEDQAIAALLHDTIEDITAGRDGADRRRRVRAGGAPHRRGVHRRRHTPEAAAGASARRRTLLTCPRTDAAILLVSASDKLHNARAIVTDAASRRRRGLEAAQRDARRHALVLPQPRLGLPGEPREPIGSHRRARPDGDRDGAHRNGRRRAARTSVCGCR